MWNKTLKKLPVEETEGHTQHEGWTRHIFTSWLVRVYEGSEKSKPDSKEERIKEAYIL